VGLIARVIEAAGIPTVAISLQREITEQVKPPRAVYLRWPFGHPMGEPDRPAQQRQVLQDALDLLLAAREPGVIVDLPYPWHGAG
jgi:D-proline reductase (dithiol) PrdB